MSMIKCGFKVLVFVLTLGLFASQGNAADFKLRLNKGEKYDMRITTEQKIVQTVMGQQQNTSQMIAMGIGFEVLAVDANGVASVKVAFQTIQIKMNGPMGLIEYDSTKPDMPTDNPIAQMMKKMYAGMVGQSLVTIRITPRGKIVGVRGLEEMMQLVLEKVGGQNENTKEMIKKMMEKFVSEDNIKMMAGNIIMVFPAEPVGIGDSWVDKKNLSIGFPMAIESTYTLKKRENGIAIVEVRSKIKPDDEAAPIEMGPVKMHMEMKGYQEGSVEINEANGTVIRSKVNMRFSGQMKIAGNEQMPQGMVIPMLIEGSVTVEPMEDISRNKEVVVEGVGENQQEVE